MLEWEKSVQLQSKRGEEKNNIYMEVAMEVKDIKDFALYIKEEISQVERISHLLTNIFRSTESKIFASKTEEHFIRHIYRFDDDMLIHTELLRFIGTVIFPYIEQNNVKTIAGVWEKIRSDDDFSDENFQYIVSFFDALYLTPSQAAQADELDPVIERLEDVWEEDSALDEEFEDTFVSSTSPLLQQSYLQSLVGEIQSEAEKKKSKGYVKKRKYFFPHLKKGGKWTTYQTTKLYAWAKKQKFFLPYVKQSTVWFSKKSNRFLKWLYNEQEFFVRIRAYQNNKSGYMSILAKQVQTYKISGKYKNSLQKIYQCKTKDTLKIIKAVSLEGKLEKEERKTFERLKNTLLIHEKVLKQPETVLDIINYGMKKFQFVLKKLSHITNKGKLNKKLESYLQAVVEINLITSQDIFRKQIEKMTKYSSLKKFMRFYPLYRLSTIKTYKELRIIWLTKKIVRDFEKKPDQLAKIIQKYFGPNGEPHIRKKLPDILVNSRINEVLWESIANERYLDEALIQIKRLQSAVGCKKYATSLYQLISTFISGESKFSFSDFKAGINFISDKIQGKILLLVRQRLQEDLSANINTILAKKGKHIKRFNALMKSLADNRYKDSGIKIFGSYPSEMEKQISELQYEENMEKTLRHIFYGKKLPESFISLVITAKKQKRIPKKRISPIV